MVVQRPGYLTCTADVQRITLLAHRLLLLKVQRVVRTIATRQYRYSRIPIYARCRVRLTVPCIGLTIADILRLRLNFFRHNLCQIQVDEHTVATIQHLICNLVFVGARLGICHARTIPCERPTLAERGYSIYHRRLKHRHGQLIVTLNALCSFVEDRIPIYTGFCYLLATPVHRTTRTYRRSCCGGIRQRTVMQLQSAICAIALCSGKVQRVLVPTLRCIRLSVPLHHIAVAQRSIGYYRIFQRLKYLQVQLVNNAVTTGYREAGCIVHGRGFGKAAEFRVVRLPTEVNHIVLADSRIRCRHTCRALNGQLQLVTYTVATRRTGIVGSIVHLIHLRHQIGRGYFCMLAAPDIVRHIRLADRIRHQRVTHMTGYHYQLMIYTVATFGTNLLLIQCRCVVRLIIVVSALLNPRSVEP